MFRSIIYCDLICVCGVRLRVKIIFFYVDPSYPGTTCLKDYHFPISEGIEDFVKNQLTLPDWIYL